MGNSAGFWIVYLFRTIDSERYSAVILGYMCTAKIPQNNYALLYIFSPELIFIRRSSLNSSCVTLPI